MSSFVIQFSFPIPFNVTSSPLHIIYTIILYNYIFDTEYLGIEYISHQYNYKCLVNNINY